MTGLEISIHTNVQIHITYAKAPEQAPKGHAHKFKDSFNFQNPWKIFYKNVLLMLYWNSFWSSLLGL